MKPVVRSIVPFIPVVALWAIIAESGVFPRAFFPGTLDMVPSFGLAPVRF
jgi:taurine transport system permease protein